MVAITIPGYVGGQPNRQLHDTWNHRHQWDLITGFIGFALYLLFLILLPFFVRYVVSFRVAAGRFFHFFSIFSAVCQPDFFSFLNCLPLPSLSFYFYFYFFSFYQSVGPNGPSEWGASHEALVLFCRILGVAHIHIGRCGEDASRRFSSNIPRCLDLLQSHRKHHTSSSRRSHIHILKDRKATSYTR